MKEFIELNVNNCKLFTIIYIIEVNVNRDNKLVKIKRRRNYLVSEPNRNTTKFFTEYVLAIKTKKLKYF